MRELIIFVSNISDYTTDLVNELNKYSIKKLVNAKPGGQGVRGAHLSEEAKKFIKLFKKIEKSFKVLTAKEKKDLEKIFGKI